MQYFVFLVKKPICKPRQETVVSISKGKTKITFSDRGLNIFWEGREITKTPGLNVAVNTAGLWTNSSEADWQVLERGKDHFTFRIILRNLPLSQIWRVAIQDEQTIDWQVDSEIEEWLHIDEFRIVCLGDVRYKAWINGYQHEYFPRLDGHWRELFVSSLPTTLIGFRFPVEGAFLPSFILETQNGGLLSIVHNPPVKVNAHIAAFRRIDPEEKKGYAPGSYRTFSGQIRLFKEESLLDIKIEGMRQEYLQAEVAAKSKAKKLKRELKVLLVNLPWQREGKWGVRAGSRWPHIKDESEGGYLPFPFFLAYATSLLQKHGIAARMVDAIAEQTPEDKFLEKIMKMNCDYLLAETSIPSFSYDLRILEKIASAGIPIILCGPNSEIYGPEFLKDHPFISFVLYGEYEFSLLELITCLQEGRTLSKVNGLIYNDGGRIQKNPPRAPFDIDLLPWPNRKDLPLFNYLDAPGEMRSPSVQMLASRGCPFKCQFCLWPQVMYQGHHYRARNVKDVVDEMEYLVKEEGFKSVYFDDDTFNIGKERMLSLCREIRARGLHKIQWAIMARSDLMDEEILENMKDAGLWAVKYGVESSTQALVENIEKNLDLKKSEKMIRLSRELGIKVHLTFTFGLPGETKETIDKTIRYALKMDPFSVQFSITTPFPGTTYHRILKEQNAIVEPDLSSYDGHYKSVIRLENLAPEDLEFAKERAYRVWSDYLRRKRGFWGDVKRFYSYAHTKGVGYSLDKTRDYLKYVALKRKKYLNSGV